MSVETPSAKVTVSALAGAVVTIILWAVEAFSDVEVPAAVAAALVVVVSFLLAYVVRETRPPSSAVETLTDPGAGPTTYQDPTTIPES